MAAYCTVGDVRNVLAPDGANDESTAAEMTDAAIGRAITDAQAEVDGHLIDRYTVPFSDVPQLVKSITTDIAAYLASLTHTRTGRLDENDVVWLRYSRASALLERLGSGAMDLEAAGEMVSTDPTVINMNDDDLFARDALLGPLPTYLP